MRRITEAVTREGGPWLETKCVVDLSGLRGDVPTGKNTLEARTVGWWGFGNGVARVRDGVRGAFWRWSVGRSVGLHALLCAVRDVRGVRRSEWLLFTHHLKRFRREVWRKAVQLQRRFQKRRALEFDCCGETSMARHGLEYD